MNRSNVFSEQRLYAVSDRSGNVSCRVFARRLGIILDGHFCSAQSIQSTIFDEAVIEGQFTEEEVQELVGLLNTGSLPVSIRRVEQRIVRPE